MDARVTDLKELLREWVRRVNLPYVYDLRDRTFVVLTEGVTGDAALERTTQNSLEDKAILELLRDSIRPHLSVELDCWYSCPKSEDYCGDKPRDVCACGADAWNERVNAVLAAWGQDTQRAG